MTPIRCANSPATAQLFVQLSLRQRYIRAPASFPILDLLLPATTARACSTKTRTARTVADLGHDRSNTWRQGRAMRVAQTGRAIAHPVQRRTFGTTPLRRGTEAIFNPQRDDEGEEMILAIAPGAAKRLSEIMARDSNPHLALRIQVESGGCHGFQYLMSLVTLPPELPSSPSAAAEDDSGEVIREDDTIFAYQADDTSAASVGGNKGLEAPKIILDSPSLELLKGSKVDFTMELIGSQFKIVDNPLATSSCGCGTSFDIKA